MTVGGEKSGGHFLLAGSDEAIASLGPQSVNFFCKINYYLLVLIVLIFNYRVASLFEAKGGGRKGRFQGKAARLDKRQEAEKLLREFKLPSSS